MVAQGESRLVARLDVGDAFGGGRTLLPEEEAPQGAGVLAQSDIKLYAIPAALLQRRGDAELWRQIKDEVRTPTPPHTPFPTPLRLLNTLPNFPCLRE